jgi:hypothetical protein
MRAAAKLDVTFEKDWEEAVSKAEKAENRCLDEQRWYLLHKGLLNTLLTIFKGSWRLIS